MAPAEQGYVRAESVTFEVGPTGDIQRVEMKDDFTKVEISKADMTDGHELPGAKLKITDASGSTIAEWETNGQPHRIERLKPGDYTLTETAAPNGYLLSEEVYFTVQETGEIQKVTMYDAPAHSLILTKRDIATNAKLADARLTIRDAYGTTIDRWTTTDGDHAIRVLPERSAAKDPHKNLLLLSDDTSEHVLHDGGGTGSKWVSRCREHHVQGHADERCPCCVCMAGRRLAEIHRRVSCHV